MEKGEQLLPLRREHSIAQSIEPMTFIQITLKRSVEAFRKTAKSRHIRSVVTDVRKKRMKLGIFKQQEHLLLACPTVASQLTM